LNAKITNYCEEFIVAGGGESPESRIIAVIGKQNLTADETLITLIKAEAEGQRASEIVLVSIYLRKSV